MPLLQLKLETLQSLDDARVQKAFEKELARVVLDCMDRPGDKSKRKVTIDFALTPIVGQDGDCEGVYGEFEVKGQVPVRRSKTYQFHANRKGHLVFSSTSPEDPDQRTIFDDEAEEAHD